MGTDAPAFAGFLADHDHETLDRVREGDLDALVYYALQSVELTTAAPIEPALSARAFAQGLSEDQRKLFLSGGLSATDRVGDAERHRLTALTAIRRAPDPGSRLWYMREVLQREAPGAAQAVPFLLRAYVRTMRFLYEKEFVAQRAGGPEAVATLYQQRGLSTDTAVEAGYVVHLGLATLHALDPARRIRRVLIVGPGLDLAPRTGLIEGGAPETFQPYAVIDSLVSLGLASLDDLSVVGADVNPRVVEHLQSAAKRDVRLTLVSGIGDGGGVSLQEDYRSYFQGIGRSIGAPLPAPELSSRYTGHLRKSVEVRGEVPRLLAGVRLDIASQRIDDAAFDLVVATNVLPYLDDTLLTVAVANVGAMLAPGGILLHNEGRALVREVASEIGLTLLHARTGAIATVKGAPPLSDAVWMYEKRRR